MFRARRKTKATSDDDIIMDALGELAAHEAYNERGRRRRKRLLMPAWLEGRAVSGIVLIVIVVVGAGVARENREFYATVTSTQGQVTVRTAAANLPMAPEENQRLGDGAQIVTGPHSYATLEFPDGSVTTLDQNTHFIVRLIEYSRGGAWRSRAFFLAAGRVWSSVGPHFGLESQMKVYTPSAVAAVRGTRYAVAFDPSSNATTIQTNDGFVTAEGFTGQPLWVGQGGQTSVAYGAPATQPSWMPAEAVNTFGQPALNQPVKPPSWLETSLLAITQTLDAPLSILGIGRCSWGVGSANYARRAAALEGLRRIMVLIEGYENYPSFVNPATLLELSIPTEEAQRILSVFDGAALRRFEPGPNGRSYRILARARDRDRTLFVLEPTGIHQIPPEQETAYIND